MASTASWLDEQALTDFSTDLSKPVSRILGKEVPAILSEMMLMICSRTLMRP